MSWKARSKMELREEFVRRVLAHEDTKYNLCNEYGISRPTGDKWIKRYLEGQTLEDRSRRPQIFSNQVPEGLEQRIVEYRKKYPVLGSAKLRRMMENDGYTYLPCRKTYDNIFHRHGLITPEASLAATPCRRFERKEPNQMWQADFKGHFLLRNKQRCHPLNVLDDRSRFNLCIQALENETFEGVKKTLEEVFRCYGMPQMFLCDNGNPWGVVQKTGCTKMEVWLMELDVLTIHGRIYHPQTQGKTERFNQTFKKECLRQNEFKDFTDAQKKFDAYREFYNEKRPHKALDLETPASVYRSSIRQYPTCIEEWDYPDGSRVCTVYSDGMIPYKGQKYFLSYGFAGKKVRIKESHLPGLLTVEFRNFRVARFNPETGEFVHRKIVRLDDELPPI